jgi:hypothetical protein
VEIELIAVGELQLNLVNSQSWHHYEKLIDLLNILGDQSRVDAMAPWEYNVVSPPRTPGDLMTRSDMAPRAQELGIDKDTIVVLNVTLTEATEQQLTEATRKQIKSLSRRYKSDLTIVLELTHPTSDTVLARLSRSAHEDRFSDVPDYDQRPAVTHLIRTSVAIFLTELTARGVIAPRATPLPPKMALQFKENPRQVLTYRRRGISLMESLTGMDPLLREASIYTRFRYFDPQMDLRDFRRWQSLPLGLTLRFSAPPLAAGDHLICVNEAAMAWRFQWKRLVRRIRPTTFTVIRNGKALRIHPESGVTTPTNTRCSEN